MARESERKELWHQLDNESDQAHEAFKVFMYLPPAERSVIRTWREWSGNAVAKREPPFFLRWSHDFAWSARTRAHDHHIEVIREEGQAEAIKEEAARQARQTELTRGRFNELLARAYEEAIRYLEDGDFLRNLRPPDVIKILQIHLEITHKLGGSDTDTPGG